MIGLWVAAREKEGFVSYNLGFRTTKGVRLPYIARRRWLAIMGYWATKGARKKEAAHLALLFSKPFII